MKKTRPATAGPNITVNVISRGDNTFNDLRRLGSAAAAPG